jgi:hypothetical protein
MLKKKLFSRVFVEKRRSNERKLSLIAKFIFGYLYGNSYGDIILLEQSCMLSFYVLGYVRFWILSFARLTKG